MKLSETKRNRNILCLGASGTGKTYLIGTFCSIMPTLVITSDKNGLETLAGMGVDPEVVLIENWANVWDRYEEIAEAAGRCLAIAIDDFGITQATSRRKIELSPRGMHEERMSKKDLALKIRQEMLLGERRLQIQQWGELWIALESFLYEVLKLPYLFRLVTALEGIEKDPRTGDGKLYPALEGQIKYTLSARFSLVCETFIANLDGKVYYALTSRPHPRIETKDRFYQGGRTWVNPTAEKLLEHMKGGGNETEIEKRIGAGFGSA